MIVFVRKSHSKYIQEKELNDVIKENGLSWSESELTKLLVSNRNKPIVNVWDKNAKPLFITAHKENIMHL